MRIGICGLGVVGTAILDFFHSEHGQKDSTAVVTYDKYSGVGALEPLLQTDVLFICLPTPFAPASPFYHSGYNTYELHELFAHLHTLQYQGLILLKSTVEPTFCQSINDQYPHLCIIHNPEFLSARSASLDFQTQHHIVLGSTQQSADRVHAAQAFYQTYFPAATVSLTDARSSSLMKIASNAFYATKIQFFNDVYALCQAMHLDYTHVQELMTTHNEWIHPMHTHVPGPDGQLSFCGSCLPKETAMFLALCQQNKVPAELIKTTLTEQRKARNKTI